MVIKDSDKFKGSQRNAACVMWWAICLWKLFSICCGRRMNDSIKLLLKVEKWAALLCFGWRCADLSRTHTEEAATLNVWHKARRLSAKLEFKVSTLQLCTRLVVYEWRKPWDSGRFKRDLNMCQKCWAKSKSSRKFTRTIWRTLPPSFTWFYWSAPAKHASWLPSIHTFQPSARVPQGDSSTYMHQALIRFV